MSKWHPTILQWHPKFWKPRYGVVLYWSKTIWRKHVFLHVAIATEGCNAIGRHNFLVQKLEAKIVRIVSMHCHAHRLASASYYIATELYSMVYETAKGFKGNYGSVLLFHRCDRLAWPPDYNKDKKSAVATRIQSKLIVEWGNSESQEWDFGYLGRTEAAVRKYKWCNVPCFVATYENKNYQHGTFVLSTLPLHLTELQNWAKVFRQDVWTLHRWKLP